MIFIGAERLWEFAGRDRPARNILAAWLANVRGCTWESPVDVVRAYGTADPSDRVASGQRVAVFNVRGNRYRVIAAINYSRQIVSILKVMTHAEYSRNAWKEQL